MSRGHMGDIFLRDSILPDRTGYTVQASDINSAPFIIQGRYTLHNNNNYTQRLCIVLMDF